MHSHTTQLQNLETVLVGGPINSWVTIYWVLLGTLFRSSRDILKLVYTGGTLTLISQERADEKRIKTRMSFFGDFRCWSTQLGIGWVAKL